MRKGTKRSHTQPTVSMLIGESKKRFFRCVTFSRPWLEKNQWKGQRGGVVNVLHPIRLMTEKNMIWKSSRLVNLKSKENKREKKNLRGKENNYPRFLPYNLLTFLKERKGMLTSISLWLEREISKKGSTKGGGEGERGEVLLRNSVSRRPQGKQAFKWCEKQHSGGPSQ